MREKILDTAFRHFVSFGYGRTSLSGIASELGKQKTAIYYYFKNKEDVFSSIVELDAANLFAELEKSLKSAGREDEILKKYISVRIFAMYNVASRYRLLQEELFVLLPQIEKSRSAYHSKEVALITSIVKSGIEKEIFRPMNEELTAKVIVNTLKGLEIPMFIQQVIKADATEIEALNKIIINGILNQPK